MFDQVRSELRSAWRGLGRSPIVAMVVVLSLGVGIGVNTVVFSWIQAFVFNPVPGVEDAGNIYVVEPRTEAGLRPGTSWREYLDLQERITTLDGLTA